MGSSPSTRVVRREYSTPIPGDQGLPQMPADPTDFQFSAATPTGCGPTASKPSASAWRRCNRWRARAGHRPPETARSLPDSLAGTGGAGDTGRTRHRAVALRGGGCPFPCDPAGRRRVGRGPRRVVSRWPPRGTLARCAQRPRPFSLDRRRPRRAPGPAAVFADVLARGGQRRCRTHPDELATESADDLGSGRPVGSRVLRLPGHNWQKRLA